jgi:hypothetical protein
MLMLLNEHKSLIKPRSISPARKRPVLDNCGDFVESVFRPENFRIFTMLSCTILRNPVAAIIDLGMNLDGSKCNGNISFVPH